MTPSKTSEPWEEVADGFIMEGGRLYTNSVELRKLQDRHILFIRKQIEEAYERGKEEKDKEFQNTLVTIQEQIKADVAKEVPPVLEKLLVEARLQGAKDLGEQLRMEKDPIILMQDGVTYDHAAVSGYNQCAEELNSRIQSFLNNNHD